MVGSANNEGHRMSAAARSRARGVAVVLLLLGASRRYLSLERFGRAGEPRIGESPRLTREHAG
jgi:hypothetical protein